VGAGLPQHKVLKGFFFEVPLIDKSTFKCREDGAFKYKEKPLELTRVKHGDKQF
jgi:hypothetical protein